MFTAILTATLGPMVVSFGAYPAIVAILAKIGITGSAAAEIASVAAPIAKGVAKAAMKGKPILAPLDEETAKRVRASRERSFREGLR